MRPAWHALLAPFPDDARPVRQPVAPAALQGRPEVTAIEGWAQVSIDLSCPGGLRHFLIVLDREGRPIAASDGVLESLPPADAGSPGRVRHESLGGRFEDDGTFRGTHWVSEAPDLGDEQEAPWESTRSEPTADQAERLRALVAEVLAREASARPPAS